MDKRGFTLAVWRGSDTLLRLVCRVREVPSGGVGGRKRSSSWSRDISGLADVEGDGTMGTRGGDMEGGWGGRGGGCTSSLKAGSVSKSQLKLSRKPRRSVVSDGEKRSAEGGRGADEGGKRLERAGSNAYSKSANGTGGRGEGGKDMVKDKATTGQMCSRVTGARDPAGSASPPGITHVMCRDSKHSQTNNAERG